MIAQEVLRLLEERLPLARRPWRELDDERRDAGPSAQAAVLVALTNVPDPEVLLGRRATHLPLHPGEIAFAGGKREHEDDSPWSTALREASEEVAMPGHAVSPIGELEPLFTRTGFEVFPCVAMIPEGLDYTVDPAEFDSVFHAPLSVFADRSIFRLKTMSDGERQRRVPHYQVGQDNVWGVTAAILAQLANVAYDAGLDLERNWTVKP